MNIRGESGPSNTAQAVNCGIGALPAGSGGKPALACPAAAPQAVTTPPAGQTWRSYYYLGGQRIAMRMRGASNSWENGVYYLHSDHLGSTSIVTTGEIRYPGGPLAFPAGVVWSQQWYKPYGETRAAIGYPNPTDRRYTGQREEVELGLYDYGARFYDPLLGRFLSADTVVPAPQNSQALNRYSYCLGNPLRYVDPSGYFTEDQIRQYYLNSGWMTEDEINILIENWKSHQGQWWSLLLEAEYGDILDADTTTTYMGMKTITGRVVGKFTEGKNGTFDFTFTEFDSSRWELSGDELLNMGGGETIGVPIALTWFSRCGFYGNKDGLPQDILLARQGVDGQYYARAGTGIYYDPAGGINTPNPDPRDAFWGWVRVVAGGLGLASGVKGLASGENVGYELAKGGFSGSQGVAGGFNLIVSYLNTYNAQQRLTPYR